MAAVCNACGRFLGLRILSKVQTRQPSRIIERNARGVSPIRLTSSRYTSISASSNDFVAMHALAISRASRTGQMLLAARADDQSNQPICSLE